MKLRYKAVSNSGVRESGTIRSINPAHTVSDLLNRVRNELGRFYGEEGSNFKITYRAA